MCNRCRNNLALKIVDVNTEVFDLHNQVIFGAGCNQFPTISFSPAMI